MKSLLLFLLLNICYFQSKAFQTCASYLDLKANTKSYFFILQADNHFYETNPTLLDWEIVDSSSQDPNIQKYVPQIISDIFTKAEVSLGPYLENIYTFVGPPSIKIEISFKSDTDVFSGVITYRRVAYRNKSERTDYYLKNFPSIKHAYFHGQIRDEDLLPWTQTFYFVGSHETSGFWP